MLSPRKKEMRAGKVKAKKSSSVPPANDLAEAGSRIRELERENAQLREENYC
jgi:hypothetical protein